MSRRAGRIATRAPPGAAATEACRTLADADADARTAAGPASMPRMWMVRADRGRLVGDFRALGVVALGWTRLAPLVHDATGREALIDAYAALEPARRRSAIVSGASQMWRFAHEMQPGDAVATYSPQARAYFVGRVTGPARHRPEWAARGLPFARTVAWRPMEVPRDALPPSTRNRLAPTLTLFRIAPGAARQLLSRACTAPTPS